MSISDRLDEIEVRRAQANSSLNGRHMLVGKDIPDMLAALRAVLTINTGDNRNVYGIDFEAGMVKALWIVHQTIATALGEEQ